MLKKLQTCSLSLAVIRDTRNKSQAQPAGQWGEAREKERGRGRERKGGGGEEKRRQADRWICKERVKRGKRDRKNYM